jgi:hydrogenase maturation protease
MVATHTMLRVEQGEFVSLTDPPAPLQQAAAACRNIGTWPVLAGDPQSRDTMLSSPIIVSDYPSVAPESPGDFFDGTEMDEMLSLRILTLTDEEKREMRDAGEQARRLLERTEASTAEELLRLHGALRPVRLPGEGP